MTTIAIKKCSPERCMCAGERGAKRDNGKLKYAIGRNNPAQRQRHARVLSGTVSASFFFVPPLADFPPE